MNILNPLMQCNDRDIHFPPYPLAFFVFNIRIVFKKEIHTQKNSH